MSHLPYIAAAWIFAVGLYGAITSRHLVHLCLCLAIIQSSTYVLFLTIGYRVGAPPPIFTEWKALTSTVDPLVQALLLTDVVVEATVIALFLSLTVQIHKKLGTTDPNRMGVLRG